jgi:hypothetical protein
LYPPYSRRSLFVSEIVSNGANATHGVQKSFSFPSKTVSHRTSRGTQRYKERCL